MHDDTKLVALGRDPAQHHGAVNTPVYHVSTVLHPSIASLRAAQAARERDERLMVYGRTGTPTSFAFEDAIAALEGGYRCQAYPSGLSAVSAALLAFVKAGDHVLVSDSVYAPTRYFCDRALRRFGVETTYYDPLIGAGIAAFLRPNTAVVIVESPGSQTFEVQDIPAIAAAAHAQGRPTQAVVLADNTWASPLYCRPLALGADVSIEAGTKYIVGHSDASIGTATATEPAWPTLLRTARQMGLCVGPDDINLAQRGLRTLAVRLARHQDSALAVATWLQARPEVARVLYPALPGDPGHTVWKRDFTGASGLFSIELKPCSDQAIAAMVDNLELFGIGYSWGGYESLIVPAEPEKLRTATAWRGHGPLLRLHIGLEAVDDLIADLAAGFARLKSAN